MLNMTEISFATIKTSELKIDRANPRIEPTPSDALMHSIRTNGIQDAVDGRREQGQVWIFDGAQRLTAARILGIKTMVVRIHSIGYTEAVRFVARMYDLRQDLNPVEKANMYLNLVGVEGSMEAAAKTLGKSKATVETQIKAAAMFATLHLEVLELLRTGKGPGTDPLMDALDGIEKKEVREAILTKAIKANLRRKDLRLIKSTVRRAENAEQVEEVFKNLQETLTVNNLTFVKEIRQGILKFAKAREMSTNEAVVELVRVGLKHVRL